MRIPSPAFPALPTAEPELPEVWVAALVGGDGDMPRALLYSLRTAGTTEPSPRIPGRLSPLLAPRCKISRECFPRVTLGRLESKEAFASRAGFGPVSLHARAG